MTLSFVIFACGLTFGGCGRSLVVEVMDARTQEPVAEARIAHERAEWRLLGVVPYKYPILKASQTSDAAGRIALADVRKGDIITVVGFGNTDIKRVWFSPLWPIQKTRSGPDTDLAHVYEDLNADARWEEDDLLLLVPVNLDKP